MLHGGMAHPVVDEQFGETASRTGIASPLALKSGNKRQDAVDKCLALKAVDIHEDVKAHNLRDS